MLMQFGFYSCVYMLVYEKERMIFHFRQFIRNYHIFHIYFKFMQICDNYLRQ